MKAGTINDFKSSATSFGRCLAGFLERKLIFGQMLQTLSLNFLKT
jgi:hypothetical protein